MSESFSSNILSRRYVCRPSAASTTTLPGNAVENVDDTTSKLETEDFSLLQSTRDLGGEGEGDMKTATI